MIDVIYLNSKRKEILFVSTILLLLSLIAAFPLLSSGWFNTHEGTDPLLRVLAMAHEIMTGQLYPRWFSTAYGGKGSPMPNFYSPGFYLTAAYLYNSGLSLLFSLKIVCISLFFIGAFGTYLWTRLHYSLYGALLAAILYLFAPYHFVDIYVRGAMSEFSALAFLPFLFYGIDLYFMVESPRRGLLVMAFASSMIIVCHNLSALMIATIALPYFCIRAYQSSYSPLKSAIAALGPLMGAGISAFYWLPVILEQKYLQPMSQSLTSGYHSYEKHFVYLWQLLSPVWGFGLSISGPKDGMSFQIGLTTILFVLLAVKGLFSVDKSARIFALILLGIGSIAVLLSTHVLSPLYCFVPGLAFVQFPWRFLGPGTLFLSAFGGLAAYLQCPQISVRKINPVLILAGGILLSIILSTNQRKANLLESPIVFNDDSALTCLIEHRLIGALCRKDEYLPVTVSKEGLNVILSGPPSPTADNVEFTAIKSAGSSMSFKAVIGTGGAQVSLPWYYFPGWHILSNGVSIKVGTDKNGFLNFNLPSGHQDVKVWFGSTAPRIAGWILSSFTLCLWMVIVAYAFWRSFKMRP